MGWWYIKSAFYQNLNSLAETQILGEKIAQNCHGGDVLLMSGELGAGKTTLTQAIAHKLGVKSVVSSPTFVMVNEYNLSDNKILAHIDLYRVKAGSDAASLGLDQLLGQSDCISIVEWPEKLAELEKRSHTHIYLSRNGNKHAAKVELHRGSSNDDESNKDKR